MHVILCTLSLLPFMALWYICIALFFLFFFLSKIQDTDDEKRSAVQSWRSECLPVFIVLCCWVATATVTKFMLKRVRVIQMKATCLYF